MSIKNNHNSNKMVISALLFAMLQLAAGHATAGGITAPKNTNANINNSATPAEGISDVYSDIDMRMRLAGKSSAATCTAAQCAENLIFDARVGSIGRYLNKAALQLYPQQENIINRMTFSVAEKLEAGTASNNKGQIVVLRGVQDLALDDDALGFVLAREMSHVLAGHHKTNTSTKLIISALASVLFPAIAIVGASSAAAQASTSLITSAASTATSLVGSEVALAKLKPTQLAQADEMALTIMQKAEWDMRAAESVLTKDEVAKDAWMLDLEASRVQLANKIALEDVQITPLEDNFLLGEYLEINEELSSDLEVQEALASEQLVEEVMLESRLTEEADLDGVKINALEANTDADSEASIEKTP